MPLLIVIVHEDLCCDEVVTDFIDSKVLIPEMWVYFLKR
jgi:hypothetical protein